MAAREEGDRPQRVSASALTAALLVALIGVVAIPVSRATAGTPPRPSFVVIVTDDQTLASFRYETMPRTRKMIGRRGTTFKNAITSTGLCCPSRASMLTGQYAHNHGVLSNVLGYGSLDRPGNVLSVWLNALGYHTIHLGKWLHEYEDEVPKITDVAPGWEEWRTLLAPRSYFDYDLQVNGTTVHHGGSNSDYLTRVLNHQAVRLIRDAPAGRPLYLQLDHYAPHADRDSSGACTGNSPIPDPRDVGRFADEPLPRPPSFNEADVSDKPIAIQQLPRLHKGRIERMTDAYRCGLESLAAVDRGVKRIWDALRETGRLRKTVIVFTSDNAVYLGEHRLAVAKGRPYEEGIRVPLVIRVPRRFRDAASRVPRVHAPVAIADLAPTILDIANAEPCPRAGPCRTMDGRSLLPLLGPGGPWPSTRTLPIEQGVCGFRGIRTKRYVYVEHADLAEGEGGGCVPTENELYDLATDPFELENLVVTEPAGSIQIADWLATRLDALQSCAGIEGRDQPVAGSSGFCE